MNTGSAIHGDMVVVGVNGGATGRGALRWALQYAKRTGSHVRAVRAWHVPTADQVVAELPDLDVAPSVVLPWAALRAEEHLLQDRALEAADRIAELVEERYEREAREGLRAAIDGARAATGATGVEVRADVVEGEPEHVLCAAANDAALLVLGRRDQSPVGEMLLGSVSHHCVRQAPCPVVIVPEHVSVRERAHQDERRAVALTEQQGR